MNCLPYPYYHQADPVDPDLVLPDPPRSTFWAWMITVVEKTSIVPSVKQLHCYLFLSQMLELVLWY